MGDLKMDDGKLTDEQAAEQLRELTKHGDPETGHTEADAFLCKLLVSLGYEKTVQAFEKVPKWYA